MLQLARLAMAKGGFVVCGSFSLNCLVRIVLQKISLVGLIYTSVSARTLESGGQQRRKQGNFPQVTLLAAILGSPQSLTYEVLGV